MVKVQQRGLGKGLSALLSESYTQAPVKTEEKPAAKAPTTEKALAGNVTGLQQLSLECIVPGKLQPRTVFDEEKLSELADSIRKNGVMQPILVRRLKRASSTKETYEIVAGERRWRASMMAGLETIPVIIRDLSDQEALEIAIIENVQRADLNPMEEANSYQRLIEEFSYTQEELSTAVGKSRSHIANLLRLLSLPEDVRTLVEQGKLSMGHARALIGSANAATLAKEIVEKGLSVRQAETMGRTAQGKEKTDRPRKAGTSNAVQQLNAAVDALIKGDVGKDPEIVNLEESLTANLGMTVRINDRGSNGGEFLIHYETLTQLDEILRRLDDNRL